eukprot:COSAG06_NODE_1078_length_10799_cov_118.610748_8_plen_136_part_00
MIPLLHVHVTQPRSLCDTLLSHVKLYAYRFTCESRVPQSAPPLSARDRPHPRMRASRCECIRWLSRGSRGSGVCVAFRRGARSDIHHARYLPYTNVTTRPAPENPCANETRPFGLSCTSLTVCVLPFSRLASSFL